LTFFFIVNLTEKLYIKLLTTVNKELNNKEEVKNIKKIVKNTIKLCVFLSVAILPFITVTQLIGFDNFIDSFENHEYYIFLQNDEILASKTGNENYIIIIKSSHPNFKIKDNDIILYWGNDGEIASNKIKKIDTYGSIKKYRIIDNENIDTKTIFENQIIGKIINNIDNNIWNSISLKIWDISIQKLNLNSFITNH